MKKEYRIKKSAEIETVIKNKKVTGGSHFVIYKMENHENEHFRCALSVPKKYGHAVDRNLMKRRVRSIITESSIVSGVDFFVVVKKNASSLTYDEIKLELKELMTKAKLLEEK